jgi:aspartyl-tRNA(Asn)/glutamyl-tRNA(Gln) amidotransferase subunit A
LNLNELTAHELHHQLVSKEIRAREIVDAVFARIDRVEPEVHAFIALLRDDALAQADRVDAKIASGEEIAPLAGIPLALKDILCAKGLPTTCGSKILADFRPPYDADTVERLRAVDSVFVGKTNMDEFAMGSSTENSAYGPTHNPWDLDRVPGGSSGGSAAAVAADEAIVALGTDTGGSIRQPASLCGLVGMKPTYGRVSRCGLIAFASSLDQIGPITKDVEDCALVMNTICGHDPRDSTSVPAVVPDYTESLTANVEGLRIGVPPEFFEYGGTKVSRGVNDAVRAAVQRLVDLGAVADEVRMPHVRHTIPTYYLIAPAEASSNLARYDGVQYGHRTGSAGSTGSAGEPAADIVSMFRRTRDEGFGAEVKRRIMLGTYALSAGYYDAYYLKASQVRTLIRQDFEQAFENFDVLISPTCPTVAFRLGDRMSDPIQMYLSDVCTIPVNLAGIPAISIPCGSEDGLPIGLHIMGKRFDESTLLRVAYTYEQAAGWRRQATDLTEDERTGRRSVVTVAEA